MMLLLEAALHSFALGAAVWIGLKVLRVENPHVEMMVWKLVLVTSLVMPLLLRGRRYGCRTGRFRP
jgi:hypothetical protein